MRQFPDNAHELGGNNGQCRATPRTRTHRGTCTALRLPLGSVDSCPLSHLVGGTNLSDPPCYRHYRHSSFGGFHSLLVRKPRQQEVDVESHSK